MSNVVIKISGKVLEYFDNVVLSTQLDSIASTFAFNSFYDVEDYEFAEITVTRNDLLIFTGVVIGKDEPNGTTPEPFNYKCYTKTGILEDCTIPLSAYPLQTQNKSVKNIIDSICSNYDITVKYDTTASADVATTFVLHDQSPTDTAKDIINKICGQKNLVLSHNANGELIVTKNIVGEQAFPPIPIKKPKQLNYRKFYNKYLVIGQQSVKNDTVRQAESIQENIDSKRSITRMQNDGDSSITSSQADSMKYDSYKANSLSVEYHDYLPIVGETYIIDNVKMVCNSFNYNYKSGAETCTVSLLNIKIYQR